MASVETAPKPESPSFAPGWLKKRNHIQIELMRRMGLDESSGDMTDLNEQTMNWINEYADVFEDVIDPATKLQERLMSDDKAIQEEAFRETESILRKAALEK